MRKLFAGFFVMCALAIGHGPGFPASVAQLQHENSDPLLNVLQGELHRAQTELGKETPSPYFISYSVYDQNITVAIGSEGGLINSTNVRKRTADVVVRVGSPALDNTHGSSRTSAISTGQLPLSDDPDAVARVLWQLTYGEYRKASQAFLNTKTASEVRAREEDTSPDFSQESEHSHAEPAPEPANWKQSAFEDLARKCSGYLRKYPYIYSSWAVVTAQTTRFHFVSTDGSHETTSSTVVRLAIQAQTRADDGMDLIRSETFQVSAVDKLPREAELTSRLEKMATDLKSLRAAPVAEPFDGPALLSGRAAAVFFHEVLGHRLEGHRQRGEKEGQTFTKKINQAVLPDFLSVADDPTARALDGEELSGWYEIDDEGIPAQKVDLIKNGILKNFLMSRMPITGFEQSNGHGRAQPGLMPTGRQGNLMVMSSHHIKDSELRDALRREVIKQGKPYGLYFEDIQGGFTLTERSSPQAFQVLPVLVWRVYADSRPDELVRGVDIVGTPLAALNRILVTGDSTQVFNGVCGAESGSVPVSASAPAMLFSEIEVQKRAHSLNRPPILPPPGFNGTSALAPTPKETGR